MNIWRRHLLNPIATFRVLACGSNARTHEKVDVRQLEWPKR